MSQIAKSCVPIRSYAEQDAFRPRFGIRPQVKAGDRVVHRHDYFEILIFTAGASMQRISLREYAAQRGSIFFIAPMKAHQVRFDPAAACFVLYFDLSFLRPDLGNSGDIDTEVLARAPELAPFAYQQDLDFTLPPDSLASAHAMCTRMLQEVSQMRLCSKELIRANLQLLLAEVTQLYEPQIRQLMHAQPPSGGGERHVKGVMKFIDRSLTGKVSLTDAARSVAVSPNYLAGLLKRETGKTFIELVTERRIERASELLSFTSMRISQVADEAGFGDVDYFSRRFRQVTGLSPSEFRAMHSISRAPALAVPRALAVAENRPAGE
jgi:AraC-like DNA-binding protein